jgi:hypothetical protein
MKRKKIVNHHTERQRSRAHRNYKAGRPELRVFLRRWRSR